MSLAWSLLIVVPAFLVSSTVAVGRCDETIIQGLRKYKECYLNGCPPDLLATDVGTHVLISANELPDDTKCVKAYQDDSHSYVTIYWKNNSTPYNYTMDNVLVDGEYIEEKNSAGDIYRLYIIHNCHHVYSYYRCYEGDEELGNGEPMVDVAIGCKYLDDEESLEVLSTAKECFKKLCIDNYVQLDPCDC